MTLPIDTARKGAALMILAGAAFALVNVAVQGATMARGAAAPTVVFWQYAIALGLCLPLLNLPRVIRAGDWRWHLLRVGLAVGGVQLWAAGLAHVPIWQAISLILLSPLFVTLGARFWLEEALTGARLGAVLLGLMGGVVILAPWTDAFAPAALLPVGAAALWAGTTLVTKRLAATEDAATLTFWLLALLVPVNLGLAWPVGLGLGGAWSLALVAGAATALAQYALAAAYRRADAAFLQPFDHVKLPLNILFGFLAFGFAPEGWIWGGVAMIAGAGLWLTRAEGRAAVVAA